MRAEADPYAPSWVDRLVARIDALPGRPFAPYLVAFVVIALIANAAAWADGYIPTGSVDAFLTSLGLYAVASFATIHYLDAAAARAWQTFRPVVGLDDKRAAAVGYELTTMPARPTLIWTIGGLGLVILYSFTLYGAPFDLQDEPITFWAVIAISLVSFAGSACFIYHTIRQLRLIGRLHSYVERVDILDLEPLHAFSGVTAWTGIVLLAIVWVSVLTDPSTFSNPAIVVPLMLVVVLAVACFVVPLNGMHGRIAAEKSRRLAAANSRLAEALGDLDRRADARDLTEADAVNKHISSLITARDVVVRTPTWPWQPETIRGFSTALVLPIVLWVVFRLLERQLT